MEKYGKKLKFLAFRSDSQMLVDTQKLIAPELFEVNLTSFAHSSLITMIKNTSQEQPAFGCQPAFGSHS